MANEAKEFQEIFGAYNSMLFKEETMTPIFCKPKLLPLKTMTMEKMDKMQKDAIEKLRSLESEEKAKEEEAEAVEGADAPPPPETKADIWSADD